MQYTISAKELSLPTASNGGARLKQREGKRKLTIKLVGSGSKTEDIASKDTASPQTSDGSDHSQLNHDQIAKYASFFKEHTSYKNLYNELLPNYTNIAAFEVYFESYELRNLVRKPEKEIISSKIEKLDQALSFYKECLKEQKIQIGNKLSSIESAQPHTEVRVAYHNINPDLEQWCRLVRQSHEEAFESIDKLYQATKEIRKDLNENNVLDDNQIDSLDNARQVLAFLYHVMKGYNQSVEVKYSELGLSEE